MKKNLISVVGPTAIGKTKLAIALAQHFNTDILSADSRQFFKEMRIGTAVPSEEELQSAGHHFIQHKSVLESYSVGDYEKDAITLLETLFKTKDTVILVGGSGLYVNAVTKGLDDFPNVDSEIRVSLNNELQEFGIVHLQEQLKKLDSQYYAKVDLENPHRLIRALEICIGSGKPYSSFLKKEKPKRPFTTVTVGISADREIIYDRINQRVDLMINAGLLEEAQSLYKFKDQNALQTVGYKELFKHFDGEWELDFAISEIKKNTRRFAKRQMTWFKKNEETLWVDFEDETSEIIGKLKSHIASNE
jgi:tRNA dimethylallyltransferase